MNWYCYRVEQVAENDQVSTSPAAYVMVELHVCLDDTAISEPALGTIVMQLGFEENDFEVGQFYGSDFVLCTNAVLEGTSTEG